MFTVKYNHNLIKIQQESNAITSGIVIAILRLYMINLNISCMFNTFCGDLGSLENLLGRKDVGPSQKVNISGPITITASATIQAGKSAFSKVCVFSEFDPFSHETDTAAFSNESVFKSLRFHRFRVVKRNKMPESRLVVGPLASVSRQPTTFNEEFFNVELLSQSSSATF